MQKLRPDPVSKDRREHLQTNPQFSLDVNNDGDMSNKTSETEESQSPNTKGKNDFHDTNHSIQNGDRSCFCVDPILIKQTKILFCQETYIASNCYYTGPGITKFEEDWKL